MAKVTAYTPDRERDKERKETTYIIEFDEETLSKASRS